MASDGPASTGRGTSLRVDRPGVYDGKREIRLLLAASGAAMVLLGAEALASGRATRAVAVVTVVSGVVALLGAATGRYWTSP